jgi:hypothetical protein
MESRLHAQIAYLRALKDESIVFLLDSDIIVNKRVAIAEDDDNYAIILTTRPSHEMAINGGLFIISGKRRAEAIAFLERVAEIHTTNYDNLGAWGGNQLALHDAVQEKAGKEIPETGDLPGGIRLVPAALYNFTPLKSKVYQAILKKRPEFLLHFKGARKKAMHLYWEVYEHRNMWAYCEIFIRACIASLKSNILRVFPFLSKKPRQ